MMTSIFSTYDPTEERDSIYYYKGTKVLKNKENIRDAKALAEYEADITMIRQYELETNQLVKGKFGVTHLKRIHKYIFQDIYLFAGKFRVENIQKGSTLFCDSQFIEENLIVIFNKLGTENYLRGLKLEEFSQRAAYYLSELNMVHPFREGNGRCIREFIRQLALFCGYIINWALIDPERLLQDTIISVNKDIKQLTQCIFLVIENE
ncbi:MAG: Fic family protein [Desulfosporosinus sp.]